MVIRHPEDMGHAAASALPWLSLSMHGKCVTGHLVGSLLGSAEPSGSVGQPSGHSVPQYACGLQSPLRRKLPYLSMPVSPLKWLVVTSHPVWPVFERSQPSMMYLEEEREG